MERERKRAMERIAGGERGEGGREGRERERQRERAVQIISEEEKKALPKVEC